MSRKLIITGVAALIAVVLIAVIMRRSAQTAQAAGKAVAAVPHGDFVAGPGRVEPNSEDIKVGSELSGKLKQVLVEEGDTVAERQIVAVLVNEDMHAQVLSSQATCSAARGGVAQGDQRRTLPGTQGSILHRRGKQGSHGECPR